MGQEKYYSSIVHSLFEEEYIKYTSEEALEEDLEYFRSEAERIIKEDQSLSKYYKAQEKKVIVPESILFLKPFLLTIDKENSIKVPDIILDLGFRAVSRGRSKIDDYFNDAETKKDDLLERIEFIRETGFNYITNLFQA